jgi:bacterioferritin
MATPSPRQIVQWLNEDLRGEHDAILHYLQHAWRLRAFGPRIQSIARDEMRHFKWLAHAIVGLGGIPDLSTPPARVESDPLVQDVAAEEWAIAQYRRHMEEVQDPAVRLLLSRIVVDEEDHLRQFQAMQREASEDPMEPEEAGAAEDPLAALFRREYQAALQALWNSFLHRHLKALGMDWEDQAVEEMKHLGWLGEALAVLGRWTRWDEGPVADPHGEEATWRASAAALDGKAEELAALLRRAAAREALQAQLAEGVPHWTVGALGDHTLPFQSGGMPSEA